MMPANTTRRKLPPKPAPARRACSSDEALEKYTQDSDQKRGINVPEKDKKQEKPKQLKGDESIVLDEEDEKILDEIWDKIGKEPK